MANVYSIPEQALRALPAHVPGKRRIRISNCQGPLVETRDPTPSTFFFDRGRLKIICQVLNVEPPQSSKPDRTFYIIILERNSSWFGFIQRRFRSNVLNFLQSVGATDTGSSFADYLDTMRAATENSSNTS